MNNFRRALAHSLETKKMGMLHLAWRRRPPVTVALVLAFSGLLLPADFAAAAYVDTIDASAPIGYWRLGEAAGSTTAVNRGTAGSTLNGTYLNHTTSVAGLVAGADTAVDFNGISNTTGTAVDVSGLNSLPGGNPFAGDWTMEAWFERDATTQWSGLMTNSTGGPAGPVMTMIDRSNRFGINGPSVTGNNVSVDLGSDMDGKRVYGVIVKTGDNADGQANLTVYANIDGQGRIASGTNNGWTFTPQDGFSIGRHIGTSESYKFNGTIDEAAAYDRALSPGEIAAHFAAASGATVAGPVIDQGADGGYADTGWSEATGANAAFGGDYRQDSDSGWAAWVPAGVAGFQAGEEYFVQVNWVTGSAKASQAQYTIEHAGGTDLVTVNQRAWAAQAPDLGTIRDLSDGYASGWYTLGRYELGELSSILLSAGPSNSGSLTADAVRISKVVGGDGWLLDDLARGTHYDEGDWQHAPSDGTEGLSYRYTYSANGQVTYTPRVGGEAELFLSWGVNGSHTSNAEYLIDIDGDLGTTGDQTTVSVSQRLLADQQTAGNVVWSGWYSAGTFEFGPATLIRLTNAGSGPMTADALRLDPTSANFLFVPEPGAAILALLALVGMLAGGRRCRRK